jgi:hypothetical protein
VNVNRKKTRKGKGGQKREKIDAPVIFLKALKEFDKHRSAFKLRSAVNTLYCATGGVLDIAAKRFSACALGALLQFQPGVQNVSFRGDSLSNSEVAIREELGYKRTLVTDSSVRDTLKPIASLVLADNLLSEILEGNDEQTACFCMEVVLTFRGLDSIMLWLKEHGPDSCSYSGISNFATQICLRQMAQFVGLDAIGDRFATHALFVECFQIPICIIETASVNDDEDLQENARLFLQNSVGHLSVALQLIPTTSPDVHRLADRLLMAVATQINHLAYKLRHNTEMSAHESRMFRTTIGQFNRTVDVSIAQFAALLVNGSLCCNRHSSLCVHWPSKVCQSGIARALFSVLHADSTQLLHLTSTRITMHALECLSKSAAFYTELRPAECNSIRTECAICLEVVEQGKSIQLPCAHQFHFNCYMELVDVDLHELSDTESTASIRCPLCRSNMTHAVHRKKEGSDGKAAEESVKLQHQINYRDTDSTFSDNFLLAFAMSRFHHDSNVRARASCTVGCIWTHIVHNKLTGPLQDVISFSLGGESIFLDACGLAMPLICDVGWINSTELLPCLEANSLIRLTDAGESRMRELAKAKNYPNARLRMASINDSRLCGRLTSELMASLDAHFSLTSDGDGDGRSKYPFRVEHGNANDADNHPSICQLANDLFALTKNGLIPRDAKSEVIRSLADSGVMINAPSACRR